MPPAPPVPPDFITLVLAVFVKHKGNMELGEALCVLGVTEKRPKWLLAQVHPDKHPEREGEATQATARVNHAMVVCGWRHVTEVGNEM